MLRRVAMLSCALVMISACGPSPVEDPSRATTCTELVEAGRTIAQQVLSELGDQTLADLEATDPQAPFAAIEEMMRTDEFEARARGLGCRPSGLELQGCRIYQGLSREAHGNLARQYLAPYFAACS